MPARAATAGSVICVQPHREEEHGHQAVVDPQQQRLGNFELADADRHRCAEQGPIEIGQRRVDHDHGQQGGHDEQDAAGAFHGEELFPESREHVVSDGEGGKFW